MSEESRIRTIVDGWAEAVRSRDSKTLAASFAPDALVFDLIEPLRYTGADAVEKRAHEWLSSFDGPTGFEVRDLKITAGEQVAFCHSLNRVIGKNRQGMKIDMWWRATVCFRKEDGRWVATHEHSSVPFDMKSGRASMGLTP